MREDELDDDICRECGEDRHNCTCCVGCGARTDNGLCQRCEKWVKRMQQRMAMMELAQAPQGHTLSGARSDT